MNAETGVSRSAGTVDATGTSVESAASLENVLKSGVSKGTPFVLMIVELKEDGETARGIWARRPTSSPTTEGWKKSYSSELHHDTPNGSSNEGLCGVNSSEPFSVMCMSS